MNDEKRLTCAGPIYFADQGIEVCSTCDGCICCDYAHIDHSNAEYECVLDDNGRCVLVAHEGRECVKPKSDA